MKDHQWVNPDEWLRYYGDIRTVTRLSGNKAHQLTSKLNIFEHFKLLFSLYCKNNMADCDIFLPRHAPRRNDTKTRRSWVKYKIFRAEQRKTWNNWASWKREMYCFSGIHYVHKSTGFGCGQSVAEQEGNWRKSAFRGAFCGHRCDVCRQSETCSGQTDVTPSCLRAPTFSF